MYMYLFIIYLYFVPLPYRTNEIVLLYSNANIKFRFVLGYCYVQQQPHG